MTTLDLSLHPRVQTDLHGHKTIVKNTETRLSLGKMPQALLLSGPKGVGKATYAYQLSRFLFQQNSVFTASVINHQVNVGTYPNLLVIEKGVDEDGKPKNNITVDDIRKVNDFIHHCAPLPGWRVVLIDGAEDMNRNASNALLKALEEPPKETLFLLVTHRIGHLLPTIRSRCCGVSFSALDKTELHHFFPQGDALTLEMAQGSLGRFYELTRANCSDFFNQLIQLFPFLLKGDFVKAMDIASSFDKKEAARFVFLETLEWVLYRLVIVSHTSNVAYSFEKDLRSIAALAPSTHWLTAAEKVNDFLYDAKSSHLNPTHILMACFFIIHSPSSPFSLDELL